MSRIFTFKKHLDTSGKIDDIIKLNNPLVFNVNKQHYIRVLSAIIPSHIQNINSYYNNNKLKLTIGNTVYNIELDDGSYSYKDIENAITNILLQNNLIPIDEETEKYETPIMIDANDVLQKIYITIDSSKLNVDALVKVDFTISQIGDVLGFIEEISGNGIHEAQNIAHLDYFGNSCSIMLDIGSELVVINENSSKELCNIILNTTTTNNFYKLENVYNPKIKFSSQNQLNQYKLVITGKNNIPLYFTDGDIIISFEISEY